MNEMAEYSWHYRALLHHWCHLQFNIHLSIGIKINDLGKFQNKSIIQNEKHQLGSRDTFALLKQKDWHFPALMLCLFRFWDIISLIIIRFCEWSLCSWNTLYLACCLLNRNEKKIAYRISWHSDWYRENSETLLL